jgi:DNA-binding MarR family transcriptional regulator
MRSRVPLGFGSATRNANNRRPVRQAAAVKYCLVMTRRLSISQLMKQAYLLGRVVADKAIQQHGLTISQYGALWRLAEFPGISGAELAREMAMTPQATQEALAGLESMGFVVRVADPRDARVRQVFLTGAGECKLEECRPTMAEVEQDGLLVFTPTERRELRRLLKRYVESLQDRVPKAG